MEKLYKLLVSVLVVVFFTTTAYAGDRITLKWNQNPEIAYSTDSDPSNDGDVLLGYYLYYEYFGDCSIDPDAHNGSKGHSSDVECNFDPSWYTWYPADGVGAEEGNSPIQILADPNVAPGPDPGVEYDLTITEGLWRLALTAYNAPGESNKSLTCNFCYRSIPGQILQFRMIPPIESKIGSITKSKSDLLFEKVFGKGGSDK